MADIKYTKEYDLFKKESPKVKLPTAKKKAIYGAACYVGIFIFIYCLHIFIKYQALVILLAILTMPWNIIISSLFDITSGSSPLFFGMVINAALIFSLALYFKKSRRMIILFFGILSFIAFCIYFFTHRRGAVGDPFVTGNGNCPIGCRKVSFNEEKCRRDKNCILNEAEIYKLSVDYWREICVGFFLPNPEYYQ